MVNSNLNKMVAAKPVKKTSASWSKLYSITFVDRAGFKSDDFYNKEYITAEEFLQMASCCTVEQAKNSSRREARKALKKINNYIK